MNSRLSRTASLVAAAACLTSNALANQQTLDCPLRQIGVDMAMKLQPWKPLSSFQQVADALNGAQEAQNCSVAPSATYLENARRNFLASTSHHSIPLLSGSDTTSSSSSSSESKMLSFPLPSADTLTVFADASSGCDVKGDGSLTRPFSSLNRAVAVIRATREAAGLFSSSSFDPHSLPSAAIVLRKGTFFQPRTLELTPHDSMINFQAYPHEEVFISGGVPLTGITWTPATPPQRPLWEFRTGTLAPGFDAAPAGMYTIAQAQSMCAAMDTCSAFTWSGAAEPTGPVQISFKYEVFFSHSTGNGVYVKNAGYLPGAANLYVADVSALDLAGDDIQGLRVAGARAIRARYPNAKTAEQMDAMQLDADAWTAQSISNSANYTFNPATPLRNDSTQDYFQTFRIGVGGGCAQRFTPQASYWCSDNSQGGGPGPYEAPQGMTISNADYSLPHTPYTGDISRANVHSWRAGRWFSWVFAVNGSTFNAATNQTTFSFSLDKGGNQGSRGGNSGQEFFIENVLDELDNPGEWFYDNTNKKLYLWYNATGGVAPPTDGTVVAAQAVMLINATGTQAMPVVGTGFLGLGFRDSSPNFLGPHGTPSGGDWAVERSGALFFEGTVGTLIQGCLLTTLDANAVFFSGYNRNATVAQNEFVSIGETAISQWGYSDGSPVPGMGFDATAGNQPRGTSVLYNFVHEVGIWTKQNSFYFQSESFGNVIEGNVAFNGPRAGVNFDDGMGGGSIVTKNVLFNFCRESSDHAPFNSQVYIFDDENGNPTVQKLNDTISYNYIIGNYHSSMAVDNDDGSSFYDTHHNLLMAAAQDAAYGGDSLKSDFGGHSNFHHDNLDLFWGKGFGICSQAAGFEDGYYNNILWLTQDGDYGSGQTCSGAGMTVVGNNTIWSPTGNVQECGMSLAAWQAKGNDLLTTASTYPSDATVLSIARNLLSVPASA